MAIKIYYIPPMRNELTKVTRLTRSSAIRKLKITSAILALMIMDIQQLYAKDPMQNIDVAEVRVMKILLRLGRFAAAIMASWEVIGNIKDGDVSAAFGVAIKYGIAYGTLLVIPWLFDLIESIFA